MSKQDVFGQQVVVAFSADGRTYEQLVAVKSFKDNKDDVVKTSTVLGEAGKGLITILDNGGTLSFEANIKDSKFEAFKQKLDDHRRGGNVAGQRGQDFYTTVTRTITYVDGSTSVKTYKGVKFHSDKEDNGGSQSESTLSFEAEYTERVSKFKGTEAVASANEGIAFFNLQASSFNTMQADVNQTGLEEYAMSAFTNLGNLLIG